MNFIRESQNNQFYWQSENVFEIWIIGWTQNPSLELVCIKREQKRTIRFKLLIFLSLVSHLMISLITLYSILT